MKLFRGIADGKPFYYREQDGTVEIADIGIDADGRMSAVGFHAANFEAAVLPCAAPSKIVCVGRNYAAHARELGNEIPAEPLLFLKAPSSIIGNRAPIILPLQSSQVEHEGELAVVIGREAKNVDESEDPNKYVFGYTCLNDVTARDLQQKDVQFTRAKSYDTFCPVGPLIETELDTAELSLVVRVNGEIRQKGSTSQMIFDIPFLLRYISSQMTLWPGDLIATGTPSGVSKLNPGDICEVEIEGIGTLENPVIENPRRL
ncbi:MAG: fumarylacetoacetate hydrolase family protein [Acidobacteriota bacterium]|nr:fumarylacetoacetate hydrolase family protein [Acidobacteriota bacterium]MDH3529174.1 fumarylacetoacetate hydrolase family protein [Acidobacteriota bacterium]